MFVSFFYRYGVTPFTPLKGILIVGPVFCCFFLAINNLAEKVQSFKDGGALWFTDLTTPDALYILPVLKALSFWITVECNAQEGLEGNPTANTIKNISRVFAALTIPLTASFPKQQQQSIDGTRKPVSRRTTSSTLSRRLKSLEKEVKGRKRRSKRPSR